METQPTTVEEAVEIFKGISKNFGKKEDSFQFAVPVEVQLMPIKVVSYSYKKIMGKCKVFEMIFFSRESDSTITNVCSSVRSSVRLS